MAPIATTATYSPSDVTPENAQRSLQLLLEQSKEKLNRQSKPFIDGDKTREQYFRRLENLATEFVARNYPQFTGPQR